LLNEPSRKILKRLESAWDKGSGEDEIFRGIIVARGLCYLSGLLRHAGAFGNNMVRLRER
jgi:hypothetical protein